jgi:hypothetical protein
MFLHGFFYSFKDQTHRFSTTLTALPIQEMSIFGILLQSRRIAFGLISGYLFNEIEDSFRRRQMPTPDYHSLDLWTQDSFAKIPTEALSE